MWDIGLNYWAILACAGVQAMIGALWYSKTLFGGPWPELVGKTAGSLAGALLTAYIMALIIFSTGASTALEGLQVGFLLWLGFTTVPYFNHVLFAGQPLKLFAINSGFNLTVSLAMSEILTLWQ